jgi:hypothetical protein
MLLLQFFRARTAHRQNVLSFVVVHGAVASLQGNEEIGLQYVIFFHAGNSWFIALTSLS